MPWDNTPAKRARDARVYDLAWRRARAAQLERQPNCELRLDGCLGRASQADHIYGTAADPGHRFLRSVCKPCHDKRTAREQGGGYRSSNRKPQDPPPSPRTQW